MISRLQGVLREVVETAGGVVAYVEPEGGAWMFEVMLPTYLAERVRGGIGKPIAFTTLMYLEGQGQGTSFVPRVIGFAQERDKRFFEVFTTVKGIGNKRALRAMAVEPARIARAIATKDAKALVELPEIGKRMAETIIAELSGKVESFLSAAEMESLGHAAEVKPIVKAGAQEEAVDALVALGEQRPEAERKIAKVAARLGSKATSDQLVAGVFGG
jgi:Holliday junction DNA helicase RuvA